MRNAQGKAVERVYWRIGTVGRMLAIGQDGNVALYLLAENGRIARIVN